MDLSHSQHCRACKQRVAELLTALYGSCRTDHSFPWPARPQAYRWTIIEDALEQVCAGLGGFRGYCDFIRHPTVPPCDYYVSVSEGSFILEFDERQHFSQARLISLSFYPSTIKLGYSVERWQQLCREVNAIDDQPFDRDERRAWYDTLRDLVPAVHGFRPTVRLYAGQYPWCSLDSSSAEDRGTFAAFLNPMD